MPEATSVLVEPVELDVVPLPELLPHPAAKPSIATRTRQLRSDKAFLDFLKPMKRMPARAAALMGMVLPSG